MAKPIIKWAGSKRKLLPTLAAFWKAHYVRYIEPFAGSACLFFQLRPTEAVLADTNGELIDTYRTVADAPRDVFQRLCSIPNDSETYYRVRDINPWSVSALDRAARFLFLNRYCFNGLYRTNAAGRFNVPYGGRRSGALPSLDEFLSSAKDLKRATLIAGDFADTVRDAGPGDFVYLDPPYRVSTRRVFREYDPSGFSRDGLARLRSVLDELDRRRVPFLVSYAESPEARLLARGFLTKRVRVRRNIAGFTSHRRIASEMLIFNCANGPS